MLADHIGHIFFRDIPELRYIGRLALPMFAYCTARGVFFSRQKGTLEKYKRSLFVFAVLSQLPFHFFADGKLNIGAVWFISVLLLDAAAVCRSSAGAAVLAGGIITSSLLLNLDYGLYGVLFPCVFYFFMFEKRNIVYLYISFAALFGLFVLMHKGGGTIQVFTFFSIPLIMILERYDHLIKAGKLFFYSFYPLHITVLLLINYFIRI